jgi:hypothetical protein
MSDTIAIFNIVATVFAVLAAPIVALWIGGILQHRAQRRQEQLALLEILLSLRHRPFSADNFKALNSIDAVFARNRNVREAWSKYFSALNDGNLNNPPGWAIREEKRRDLMTSIISSLGLARQISTSDLLRTYSPTVVVQEETLAIWERIKKREDLRDEFIRRGIAFPDLAPIYQEAGPSPAAPSANPAPPQPDGPAPEGNPP